MKIHEAAENYLETILIINNRQGHCRAVDICNELKYSKPTVSVVMKQFREDKYIATDKDGKIALTEKGLSIAKRMYERHELLAAALISIGVSKETAYEDACKIEHDLSDESFSAIKNYFSN